MHKQDLALNNLLWLMYHKTKPNQIKTFSQNAWKNFNGNTKKRMQLAVCNKF